MAETHAYDRERAVSYARRWAFDRNPLFYDFTGGGGNCTNFISQCLLAGTCQMNFAPTFGWYYISADDRAPAWTGVEFLYNFLTDNAAEGGVGVGLGPFGREVNAGGLELGDVIQLGRSEGDYFHTLLVTGFSRRGYLVAAHSDNAFNRPLSTYNYQRIRYIHIDGFRTDKRFVGACYEQLIEGESLGI
ncbi:MAG: amidase domain-containing protein [Clostridia bacterium]|nr:amidase domain-containing protein [Clostridia bacterium]